MMPSQFDIIYSKKAQKFLRKNSATVTEDDVDVYIRKAIKRLTGDPTVSIDLVYMKGKSKGKFRIRTGNLRIVFTLKRDRIYVATVEDIGFRGDIYRLREAETEYTVVTKKSRAGKNSPLSSIVES